MTNTRIIKELERVKGFLIYELRKYLERKKGKKIKCEIILPVYSYDTYSLEDGCWRQILVKSLYLDKEDNEVMIVCSDGDCDTDDSLKDCFSTSEIIDIIDKLN